MIPVLGHRESTVIMKAWAAAARMAGLMGEV